LTNVIIYDMIIGREFNFERRSVMEYFAHKTETGKQQTIFEHLTQTAKLAEKFSVSFLKSIAYSAGLAHDIGKYAVNFQKRLDGNSIRFEHAVCGAIEYQKLAEKSKKFYEYAIAYLLAYCIVGHHTGLPDGGSRNDSPDDECTLYARLKREYAGNSDYQAYRNEISLTVPQSPELIQFLNSSGSKQEYLEQFAFFTRYIFSCLTDADFLDTEIFCNPAIDRSTKEDFEKSLLSVQEKLDSFKHETNLQKARAKIQEQAFASAQKPADISILNMPTGSGKTLCSLKISLEKIRSSEGRKKRIIYVIPFTSIIEQTAEEFEELFGEYTDILQHHSNFDFDMKQKKNDEKEKTAEEEPDTVQKMKLASENWDVPVVITTSVQFFESLYHYRSSRLRKLHNMADSIIIFDEIHTLPLGYLIPCLKGIGYLTKYLNSEAIFLSATMPDYSELFQKHLPNSQIQELVPDKSDFSYFQKCSYHWLGQTDFETIIQKTENYQSSLIIVNKKDTARALYQMLDGKKFHLSTNMTPCDRSETIQKIRTALKNKEKITVVSTSLIEAGVDLDFETVFRELAGLDSILQAGGRCNREGRRSSGDVFVFSTDMKMKGEFQTRAEVTSYLLKKYSQEITSPQCIQEYYHSLFHEYSDKLKSKTLQEFQGTNLKTLSIPFRSYAEQFKLIQDKSIGIVIDNCPETADLLTRLKSKDFTVKRALQKYTVSLHYSAFEEAFKMGILEEIEGIFRLNNPSYYDKETGIDTKKIPNDEDDIL